MNLQRWQESLVEELTTPAEPTASTSPGLRLTRQVQREWRAFRIRSSLPLTNRLLGADATDAIDDYLDAVAAPSSFFLQEAAQFAARCLGDERPHLASVVRFELAMLRAVQARAGRQSDAGPGITDEEASPVVTQWAADVIPFRAPPERVLLAAASPDWPSPPPSEHHLLLCTPLVCRPATRDEAALFDALRQAAAPTTIILDATARSLVAAGALVIAPAT
jgi:hypothetical protein